MTVSRRKFIALVGGGAVLAASAGAGGFVATRTPTEALAPWSTAGGYAEKRMRALSYAVLAPNPHNRQPWVAELTGEDELVIWRDPARNLPHTDPFDRQLTIGMGCFLELLRMAAAEDGHMVETEFFPEGEDGPVARLNFMAGGQKDPLFANVMDRHTNREPYEDRPLPAEAVAALGEHAEIVTDAGRVADLRALAVDAMTVEFETHRTYMESVDLMRLGKAQINANPDGIALGGAFLESLMLAGLLTREGLSEPGGSAQQMGLDMQKEGLNATPAFSVTTTPGNTREDQIEAGRKWLRLHLAATGLGLAMQPVSQALQEYPEMAALYGKAHAMLAKPGETVQMLGRIGYGPAAGPSPRWPLESRLKNA